MNQSVVIVTGASRGIGLAIAQMLLNENYHVFGLARHAGPLNRVTWIPCDVTDPESVKNAFDTVVERTGRIEASVRKMEISEQHGMSTEQVALALRKLLRRKKLPPHYIVGFSNQILGLLNRLLPTRWMLYILGKIYG